MDMNIDNEWIKAQRANRAWSQEQLAAAAGLSLRTVQRIEKTGVASNESVKALAAVFETSIQALGSKPQSRLAERRVHSPVRVGLGFATGAIAGMLITGAGTASAVDYTVRSFINNQPIAVRSETRGDLNAVTVPLVDASARELARVRILVSELDSGNVRFDLVLYNCTDRGCSQTSAPALETVYNVPARVEWTKDSGEVIAYEFTPSK